MSIERRNPHDRGVDRRGFMKASAAALGSLAVGPLATTSSAAALSPLPTGRTVRSRPGSAPIRIGLVGCGGRGTGAVVQALSSGQDVQLVAMGDAFADRLEGCLTHIMGDDLASELGPDGDIRGLVDVPESRRYVGFDAYQRVIPHADVVILTTPPGFRPQHFEAAIRADKQVFMEKPVATDAPGIRKVLEVHEIAKQKKLNVVVGLQRHYQSVYRELGRPHPRRDDRRRRSRPSVLEQRAASGCDRGSPVRPRWSTRCGTGTTSTGSAVTTSSSSTSTISTWATGSSAITRSGRRARAADRCEPARTTARSTITTSSSSSTKNGGRVLSQCRHMPDCMNRVSEAFHGTNGVAPRPGLILSSSGSVLWEHDDAEDPNPYQVEHDELFAAIAGGEFRYADAEQGAIATMTSILGRMATYSGRVVEWDEALASDLDLMPASYAWDAVPPVTPDGHGRYPIPIPGVSRAL